MLTPRGCDLDVVLVHGLLGRFPVQQGRPISQVQRTQLGGTIRNWRKRGAQRHPCSSSYLGSPSSTGSLLVGGQSPRVSFGPLHPHQALVLSLSLSWCWGQSFLPVVRKPVRGSLSSKPRTETTVTS